GIRYTQGTGRGLAHTEAATGDGQTPVSVALYMDVHVPSAITNGLRLRGVDVLTYQEDGTRERSDPALLDRATALHRLLFTRDEDLLREAARRQQTSPHVPAVVQLHAINLRPV